MSTIYLMDKCGQLKSSISLTILILIAGEEFVEGENFWSIVQRLQLMNGAIEIEVSHVWMEIGLQIVDRSSNKDQ